MREADDLRSRNEGDWWKALEATLAAVGSVADSLLDMQDEEQATGIVESFDLDNLFKNVLPQLLNMTGESGAFDRSNSSAWLTTCPCQIYPSCKVAHLCLQANMFLRWSLRGWPINTSTLPCKRCKQMPSDCRSRSVPSRPFASEFQGHTRISGETDASLSPASAGICQPSSYQLAPSKLSPSWFPSCNRPQKNRWRSSWRRFER